MAAKISKVQDIIGKEVKVACKDRYDSEYFGNLIGIDPAGVLLAYSEHGRDFTGFIPMENIDVIFHKHLAETK